MLILVTRQQNGMRQVRGLLRESPGENVAERQPRGETVEDGGAVDTDEEPVPPFAAACHTGALSQRHLPGGELRRQHHDRGVLEHLESGDRLQGRSSLRLHAIQRRPDREGSRTLYRPAGEGSC